MLAVGWRHLWPRGDYIVVKYIIPMMTKYMYLGCVVDDFLALTVDFTKEHRAEIGKRVNSWLQRCRQVCVLCTSMLNLKGRGTFLKSMDVLVESVLLYGAYQCWDVCRGLRLWSKFNSLTEVCRSSSGLVYATYKASLWSESGMSHAVTWIARVRCASFRLQVLNDPIYNGRILKKVLKQLSVEGSGYVR